MTNSTEVAAMREGGRSWEDVEKKKKRPKKKIY